MISGCAPLPPLWPGSMTTTFLVMLPPPLLALVVVFGGAGAVVDLVVLGGVAVDGGSTLTVLVTVAGSSDTVVVGLPPPPAPGADVVLVTVTEPPVPAVAVAVALLLVVGVGDFVAVGDFDVALLPGNGATVTWGPLEPTALEVGEEDDEPSEVPVVGGAATPVPQAAVSTAAAATMTRRCRARIRPRCHADPLRRGRLGRSGARIGAGSSTVRGVRRRTPGRSRPSGRAVAVGWRGATRWNARPRDHHAQGPADAGRHAARAGGAGRCRGDRHGRRRSGHRSGGRDR